MRNVVLPILTVALLLSALLLGPPSDSSSRALVRAMAGEYSYRVTLSGSNIGHYTTAIEVAEDIVIRSRLHAQVSQAAPFDIEERLRFASGPPHQLLSATATERNATGTQVVQIGLNDDHYTAQIDTADGRAEQRVLQWPYHLGDHLALERWLRDEQPTVGAEARVSTLDFDRLAPTPETWRVVGKIDDEYTVATSAPLDDTLVQLDSRLVPQVLSTAGLFTITRTDAPAPVIDARGLPALSVAIDEPITEPDRVAAVILSVNEAAARHFDTVPGTRIEATNTGWRLHRTARASRPATAAEAFAALGESVAIPTGHPSIQALAARVVGRTDRERLESLTRLIHNHLSYNETTKGTLIDAVINRQGDCTEFSDLLTAVARALGLPAVTVTGLTYGEVDGPGFYLHAWNEVIVDGAWVAVDPTWNLTRVDALHIPLPNSSVRFLAAYAEMNKMDFAVESVRYF